MYLLNRWLKKQNCLLNGTQLEEGVVVEEFKKEMGGLVYFNETDDEEPISLFENESHAETYPFSTRWIPQEERYFLIKCFSFHLGTDMSITQVMVF